MSMPEQRPRFEDANPISRFAQATAIAGGMLCDRAAEELYIDTSSVRGGPDPRHPDNKIVLETVGPSGFATLVLGSREGRTLCYEESVGDTDQGPIRVQLVPDQTNPGKLSKVTLCGPEWAEKLAGREPATHDTMLDMVRAAADRALIQRRRDLPWDLFGTGRRVGAFIVSANRLVPVVGRLLRAAGSFVAQKAPEGLLVSSRFAVDVGGSGRVYGNHFRTHQVGLSTKNTVTQTEATFGLQFEYGGVTPNEEFTIARCTLTQRDLNTGRFTEDTLSQQGDQLIRTRRIREGSGNPLQVDGEHRASDRTILDMAAAAIAVSDIEIR